MSKHYAMCYFDDESGNYVPMEVRPESDHLNLVAENAMLKAELKAINAALDDPQTDITMTACEVISALKEQVAALGIENSHLCVANGELKEQVAQLQESIEELTRKYQKHAGNYYASQDALAKLQSKSAALVVALEKAARHVRPTCDELYYELNAALAAFKEQS